MRVETKKSPYGDVFEGSLEHTWKIQVGDLTEGLENAERSTLSYGFDLPKNLV